MSPFGRSHLTQQPARRPKLASQVDFLICIDTLRARERRGNAHWEAPEDHHNRCPQATTAEIEEVNNHENALNILTQARDDHTHDLGTVESGCGGRGGLGLGLSGSGGGLGLV